MSPYNCDTMFGNGRRRTSFEFLQRSNGFHPTPLRAGDAGTKTGQFDLELIEFHHRPRCLSYHRIDSKFLIVSSVADSVGCPPRASASPLHRVTCRPDLHDRMDHDDQQAKANKGPKACATCAKVGQAPVWVLLQVITMLIACFRAVIGKVPLHSWAERWYLREVSAGPTGVTCLHIESFVCGSDGRPRDVHKLLRGRLFPVSAGGGC